MSQECQRFREMLSELRTGEGEKNEPLAQHLASCAECREFVAAMAELDGAFLELKKVDVPENVVTKVFQTVDGGRMQGNNKIDSSKPRVSKRYVVMRNFVYGTGATAMVALLAITFVGRQGEESFRRVGSSISTTDATLLQSAVSAAVGGERDKAKTDNPGLPEVMVPIESRPSAEQPPASRERKGESALVVPVAPPRQNENPSKDLLGERASEGALVLQDEQRVVVSPGSQANAIEADSLRRLPTPYSAGAIASSAPMMMSPSAIGERYGQYSEGEIQLVTQNPVSTFSIDVDTGSYTNVRRFLTQGSLPPADAVRVEEFINYFDYNYPTTNDGRPFTLNYEIAPSPLAKGKHLLKVGIKAQALNQNTNDRGWNLVFLVDTSGSMSDPSKLPLLKESLKTLVRRMRAEDRIAIVTYAGSAGTHLESTSGSEREQILNAIDALQPGGSTNGSGGIVAAYDVARKNRRDDGVNRVILATDGDFNVGITSFNDLVRLVEEKRRDGITLTTLGFGSGNYNEQNLEQLANKGNGNYFYIDTLEEGRKVLDQKLVSNMETVAKDVKLQIEFNPDHVLSYRLIGYDNRTLAREDFNNDTVDAGEIGAGHTVTALYEVQLAGHGVTPPVDELRYRPTQKVEAVAPKGSPSPEFAFLKVRYKAPNVETSKLLEFPMMASSVKSDIATASNDFRFVAAVAGFGQILRASKHAGGISLVDVEDLARDAIATGGDTERQRFLDLVRMAKHLRQGYRAE